MSATESKAVDAAPNDDALRAKRKVKRWLGTYLLVYLVVAGGYLAFSFSGDETWTPEDYLKAAFPGGTAGLETEADFRAAVEKTFTGEGAARTAPGERRAAAEYLFENEARERVTLAPGERMRPDEVAALGYALARDIERHPDADHRMMGNLRIYKENFLTRRNWPWIMNVLNLSGFFILVGLFLWGPLSGWLSGSAARAAETVANARAAEAEAAALKKRYETLLAELEERQKTLDEGLAEEMAETRARIETSAKREAEGILAGLKTSLDAEVRHAAARIRGEVVREALDEARKLVEEKAGEADHNAAVDALIGDLGNMDLKK